MWWIVIKTLIASVIIVAVSLGVKAVFVLLTILGHANLWTAIAADMGVSLVVVFNALRLLRTHGSANLIAS